MIESKISEIFPKIHFIGIGGVSMSALAKYCICKGVKVSGSDCTENQETQMLEQLGAKIFYGHSRQNAKGADVIVYTSAVTRDNPELQFAFDNGKTVYKRSEFLALIERRHKVSVAVAGCHGKTTCTAMLTHIFKQAGYNPTSFIGGEDRVYGNFVAGENIIITEACEYKRNFLVLKPTLAVILNIDNDHMDCYGDIDELTKAYGEFVSGAIGIINADDERAVRAAGQSTVSFGISRRAMYGAAAIKEYADGCYGFALTEYGKRTERMRLAVPGKHNIYNALAAIAVAAQYGISARTAAIALKNFKGVLRRAESLGRYGGSELTADYAHHPREIEAVLGGFAEKPLVVFQPHTYSRTKLLMNDFCRALNRYDCIIYKTYAARETYDVDGSGFALYKNLKAAGGNTVYAESAEKLFVLLDKRKGMYPRIIFLGAGDVYGLARQYAARKIKKDS